ncbi:MAG TPA: hypothetical protein VHF47_04545 [Acidimicrobiales bacterium]|nr:hypothetical protein [Acidimicrobiales bacterium]
MRRRKRWAGLVATALLATAAWLVPATPAHAAGTLSISPGSTDFGEERVGTTFGEVRRFTVTATGEPVIIEDVLLGGDAQLDFFPVVIDENDDGIPDATYCYDTDPADGIDTDVTLAPGQRCVVDFIFVPTRFGARNAVLAVDSNAANDPTAGLTGEGTTGYYIAGTLGQVAAFGDALDFGDLSELDLNAPIVGIATTADGDGYWLTGRDGGIFAFGNADFAGSMGGVRLNQPIVGMAGLPDPFAEGYYQVAADGGIFAWGDAEFHGSTGNIRLNQPIVGMAVHPSNEGYWLVARDGGVFAFGEAGFHGSTGNIRLNQPIVGMTPTPSGEGYWLVARDGGIFAFGDADFHGSTGNIRLNSPITGMASTPLGDGYWMVAQDGGIFAFDATFHGSLPSSGITGVNDVVGIAPTAPPLDLGVLAAGGKARPVRPSADGFPAGVVTRSR